MRFCLSMLLVMCIAFQSIAQLKVLTPEDALKKFKEEYPQEKVYLQLSKQYFNVGETIWMKAWCMLDGMPTFLSRIIYVEMVDVKGIVVAKKMYALDSLSSTPMDIDIPNNLETGNYAINAYTLWMQNFPQFICTKSIYILGASKTNASKSSVNKSGISIQFYPEGGDLIDKVSSTVAFKIADVDGMPLQLSGVVTDVNGKQITTFQPAHDGLGRFELLANQEQIYNAEIKGANGAVLLFKLPQVRPTGIVMKIENSNASKVFVSLLTNSATMTNLKKVRVVAQMSHQVFYSNLINLEDVQTTIPINKKNLPAGIAQITVFTEDYLPLAERLFFVSNYEIEKPNLESVKFDKKAGARENITFSTTSPASLSVTIVDANVPYLSANESIVSSFLVESDLKGYIHNPHDYFADKSTTTIQHLDLLMLTHGWRRFDWKKISKQQFPTLQYPVETAISVRGVVTKSDRNVVVKDGKVSFLISAEDSTKIMANAVLTDKGEFLLSNLTFKKKAQIAYQGTNNKKENLIVDVKLAPSFIDSLSTSIHTPFINLDTVDIVHKKSALAAFLLQQGKRLDTIGIKDLGNVTVLAKKMSREDSLNHAYATGLFAHGRSIDPDEYKNVTTVWQIIQRGVPGVVVEGNFFDPDVRFSRYDGANSLSTNNGNSAALAEGSNGESLSLSALQSNGIAFFLNEINVSKDVISSLSVDDIAYIKVLKSEAIALGASAGAIAIYTKKGLSAKQSVYDKTFTIVERQGYAITKVYAAPPYRLNPDNAKTEDDRRYTLFWSGHMQPSKDGKYRFTFFNNDTAKKIRLFIQGYDKEGNFIYLNQFIE